MTVCTRKSYKGQSQAGYVAKIMSQRTGKMYYAEPCQRCNAFHVTTGR